MKIPVILNPKSVKGFIKGSLVLIGLFAVLYCGIAMFVLNFGDKLETNKNIVTNENIEPSKTIKIDKKIEISKKIDCKVFALVLILSILPLMIFIFVFFRFSYLVKSYYKKLYGSEDGEGALYKIKTLENQEQKRQENEKQEQKMQEIKATINACNMVANSIKPEHGKQEETFQKLIKEMLERLSEICKE